MQTCKLSGTKVGEEEEEKEEEDVWTSSDRRKKQVKKWKGNGQREKGNHWNRSSTLGRLLVGNGLLFTHGTDDGDKQIFTFIEGGHNFFAHVALRNFDIIFGGAILGHKVEEAIINVNKLVFATSDVGDIHVVGGGADIFELLAGEDINRNKMDFGVTVFASLGGGHVDDLARTTFDADVSVFTEGRALHGEGGGSPCIGRLERLVVLLVVGHDDERWIERR